MALKNVEKIAKLGEEIYEEKKEFLEKDHLGKFVAINVESSELFIADSPEEASRKAKEKYPNSISFLTKIGPDRGVFSLKTSRGHSDNWLFRSFRISIG